MNRELETLILVYEKFSSATDKEAGRFLLEFDTLLDEVMKRNACFSRDVLRKSVIKAHRKWALKQDSKPPTIPPRA